MDQARNESFSYYNDNNCVETDACCMSGRICHMTEGISYTDILGVGIKQDK